jgi:hypothetical protein
MRSRRAVANPAGPHLPADGLDQLGSRCAIRAAKHLDQAGLFGHYGTDKPDLHLRIGIAIIARLALPSSGERAALVRKKKGAFVRKRVKASFDPKIFLANVGEGKTISKYRKDQVVFSQGQVAEGCEHFHLAPLIRRSCAERNGNFHKDTFLRLSVCSSLIIASHGHPWVGSRAQY